MWLKDRRRAAKDPASCTSGSGVEATSEEARREGPRQGDPREAKGNSVTFNRKITQHMPGTSTASAGAQRVTKWDSSLMSSKKLW